MSIDVWTNDVPAWEPFIPPNSLTNQPKDMRYWDGITCKFVRDWEVHVDTPYISFKLKLKTGFRTDGGSIPRVFWSLISPYGIGILAWFIHDALYATHALPRWLADMIMRDLLVYVNMSIFTRNAAYRAVRLCGSVPYNWCELLLDPATGEPIDRWYWVKENRVVPDYARLTTEFTVTRTGPLLKGQFDHMVQPVLID